MKLLYFAWLQSRVGLTGEEVSPPASVATVGDLLDWLKTRSDRHAAAFADADRLRAAVNQEFAGLDHPLRADDEVAFFPPVTGG
ncbi:MAG TPA: molybdopterin converting factor subunit 1 [Rhodospirillaceae bacterium]|nr:molybdopterin converting factor subunit 1 [Rhodospirillaceae bacterium]